MRTEDYLLTPLDHLVRSQNGNLTNTDHLRYYLDHYAHRHINTSSDSELLLNLLADALQKTGKFRIDGDDIFRAVREVMQTTSGAYACTAMIAGYGIFGFRDPHGIRPMGWARRKSETVDGGWDYMMASESVVCDALGFQDWTDVKPGASTLHSLSSRRARGERETRSGEGRERRADSAVRARSQARPSSSLARDS